MDYMTTNEAREYFTSKNLTYNDITEGDICVLVMLLNKNIKQACKNNEMSVNTVRMSQKIRSKYDTHGRLIECYLFVNSHYFRQRECISFNKDGFIGFCGELGGNNPKPIIKSFVEWVDYLDSKINESVDKSPISIIMDKLDKCDEETLNEVIERIKIRKKYISVNKRLEN